MFDHVLERILAQRGISERTGRLTIEIDKDLKPEATIVDGLIRSALKSGMLSNLLRNQLVASAAGIPVIRKSGQYMFETEAVLGAIRSIEFEENVGTRAPKLIKKGALKGLYVGHFFQASFIPQNLLNENANGKGVARLIKAIKGKYGKMPEGKLVDESDILLFSDTLVRKSLDERNVNKNITGEHIFFTKFNNINYFLHVDSHVTPDVEKIEFIKHALDEFDELKKS